MARAREVRVNVLASRYLRGRPAGVLGRCNGAKGRAFLVAQGGGWNSSNVTMKKPDSWV